MTETMDVRGPYLKRVTPCYGRHAVVLIDAETGEVRFSKLWD